MTQATQQQLLDRIAQLEQIVGRRDAEVVLMQTLIGKLKLQIARFKRDKFGTSSEKAGELAQMELLLEELETTQAQQDAQTSDAARPERAARRPSVRKPLPEHLPRETQVHESACGCPECGSADLVKIGEDVSEQLELVPERFKVIRHVRPKFKCSHCTTISQAAAPSRPIARGIAGAGLLAHVLVSKYADHLPLYRHSDIYGRQGVELERSTLYRQHQRLMEAGFKLSRPWLTQLARQGAQLLEPIYQAQFDSIRASRVKAMDETPIKAGRAGAGKMGAGFYWPVYGELDEVCFPYFESRRHEHVQQALGLTNAQDAVLLSDGYEAYASYAKKAGVTHAQCWIHTRRTFFEAKDAEPQAAGEALRQIGALYKIEEEIQAKKLSGEHKRLHRLTHSKPLVEQFFEWIDNQFEQQGLLPSNPLTKALAYARERTAQLQVFLDDPDVPMDTNHLERALRPILMGRRNWLFCWTEVGAKHAGIVQSLIATCRLHGIDPYTYLVDVLQRVGQHPAARVAELTPRLWKQHFADNPLHSDLDAHTSGGAVRVGQ